MALLTPQRGSQVAVGVLLLIIIRSLGEYFRLQYVTGLELTLAQVSPFVGSALFTAGVLALALLCHASGRYWASIGAAIATVLLLLTYKVAVLG
ncbi:MAG: hypothetical protein WC829_17160 [Hyphomicrobium sp.]|jgi:hypothetical protein